MNPKYGIFMWIFIGALAGWLGSILMNTDARQGGLANILIGMGGAIVGGFLTERLFNINKSRHGLMASLATAVLGAVLVIFIWQRFF